jgi:hypothetical protein
MPIPIRITGLRWRFSVPATTDEQLLVASKLMQHYRVFTPLSAGTAIQAVSDSAGNVELVTQGNDGGLYNLWPDPDSDTGWQITSLNATQANLGAVTSFTATQSPTGNITVLAQFADAPNATYSVSDERWSPGWQKISGANAVAAPQFGAFFSVQNGVLFYQPASGPKVQLSGEIQVSMTYVSGRNFQGFLEAFILGTDKYLYHVRAAPDLIQPADTQPDPEAAQNWTQMVQLNPVQSNTTLQFSLLTLANDKDGYSKLFAVSTDDDLYAIWQDAETTDWNFEGIEIPDYNPQQEGPATEINAYMTEITVLDSLGAPRPKTTVTLWSSDETPAIVNGRSAYLDALTPYTCLANAAGKVTVVVENNTLDAPMLKVTTDFMDGDEYISVEPNAYIQEQLLAMTPSGLTGATNVFSGQPVTVVPANLSTQTLDAIASGVSQCMSLAGTPIAPSNPVDIPGPDSSGANAKYLVRNKNQRGLKYVPKATGKFEHRIDLSRVKEQHWRFVFDHKTRNHRFEMLTQGQAASLMADRKATLKAASFLDDWFDVDWGDVWDSIESVAELVVTTIVDTVTNVVTAIQAQVTLLIDGITYLYEQAVDLVQQVFDAVEGMFESVGTFFEQLFDWFAFLFAWGDILLTQQALSALITQVALPFAGQVFGAGGTLNTLLKGQIQSFQSSLNTIFTSFLNSPGINDASSILAVQQTIPPSDMDEQTAGTNLAFSGLLDNVNSVKFTNPGGVSTLWKGTAEGATNPFTTLTNELVANLGAFLDSPTFSQAAAYFQALGENPDQFLTNALKGTLSIIQGVLNIGLNVASAVIDAIFACVQSALNALAASLTETLYVPLASELYTLVTGLPDMTILGLFSLIAAIPVTIGYKILFQVAPFADTTAVTQFVQDMNQALTPVTAAAKGELRAAGAPQAMPPLLVAFLGCILGTCFVYYGFIEAILDSWIVPPDVPLPGEGTGLPTDIEKYADPPAVLSWGAIAMEWMLFIAALPGTPAAPACDTADSMGTMTWLVGGLSPLLDSGWLWFTSTSTSTGTIMRNAGTLGTSTDWILAMVQFGMLCGLVSKQVDEGKANAAVTMQAFFAAIPGLFKFFRLPPINRWAPGLRILAVLDLIGDEGAALAETYLLSQLGTPQAAIAATA